MKLSSKLRVFRSRYQEQSTQADELDRRLREAGVHWSMVMSQVLSFRARFVEQRVWACVAIGAYSAAYVLTLKLVQTAMPHATSFMTKLPAVGAGGALVGALNAILRGQKGP